MDILGTVNMEIKFSRMKPIVHKFNPIQARPFVPFNPSCTKVFGTHTFYEGGGGGGGLSRPPYDLENGRLYKLQLWQAIRTIYER